MFELTIYNKEINNFVFNEIGLLSNNVIYPWYCIKYDIGNNYYRFIKYLILIDGNKKFFNSDLDILLQ